MTKEEKFIEEAEQLKKDINEKINRLHEIAEDELNEMIEDIKNFSKRTNEEIAKDEAFYAGEEALEAYQRSDYLRDQSYKNKSKKEDYEAASKLESENGKHIEDSLDSRIAERLAERDKYVNMTEEELKEVAKENMLETSKSYLDNEENLKLDERSFEQTLYQLKDEKKYKSPVVIKAVEQVVQVELEDQKFISRVKNVLKKATMYGAGGLGISTLVGGAFTAMGASGGAFGDAFQTALCAIGAATAVGFAIGGAKEAIKTLSANMNYEENVRLLKEAGLYEYVEQVVEAKKKEIIDEAEFINDNVYLKNAPDEEYSYNKKELEEYKEEKGRAM